MESAEIQEQVAGAGLRPDGEVDPGDILVAEISTRSDQHGERKLDIVVNLQGQGVVSQNLDESEGILPDPERRGAGRFGGR